MDAFSNTDCLDLNAFREGALTTFLVNEFQVFTTLLLKELVLTVSLNLFLNSVFEWPLVVVLLAIVKKKLLLSIIYIINYFIHLNHVTALSSII